MRLPRPAFTSDAALDFDAVGLRFEQHVEVVGHEREVLAAFGTLLIRRGKDPVVGVAGPESFGQAHVAAEWRDADGPAVGKREALDQTAVLGELEEHPADLAAPEAQVRIDARDLELVDLAQHRLRYHDVRVGIGEQGPRV